MMKNAFYFTLKALFILKIFKGYLRYKTNYICHKVAIDAPLMSFLFEEKILLPSPDI